MAHQQMLLLTIQMLANHNSDITLFKTTEPVLSLQLCWHLSEISDIELLIQSNISRVSWSTSTGPSEGETWN